MKHARLMLRLLPALPCLSVLAGGAGAAVHCVGTPAEFQAALTAAAASAADDEIRMRGGHYQHGLTFDYHGQHADGLEISGGWTADGGDACGAQLPDARLTRLDGGNDHQILRLQNFAFAPAGDAVRFSVSNLHFDSGFSQGTSYGGALGISNMGDLPAQIRVDNVLFTRNRALFGGALYFFAGRGSIHVGGSVFDDNRAQDMAHVYGIAGAHADTLVDVVNSTFGRGRCLPDGAGDRCSVHLDLSSHGRVAVANSLFWDNGLPDLDVSENASVHGEPVRIDSSLLTYDGNTAGAMTNLLSGDPQFVAAGAGDYALRSTSPFIDQGSTSLPSGLLPVDMVGHARVQGGGIDPGALEYTPDDLLFANGFEVD